MCGIVGMIGSGIDYGIKKVFKDLLIIDTIRGGDSTGFIGVDGDDVVVAKKATDGYAFTNMTMFTKQMSALSGATALIGHNRWATKGKVTDGNAHPFKSKDTYLVHNGSLTGTGWSYGANSLHNASLTDVDSEAICFNIEHEGIKETVAKLNGAFALVVYNDTLGTVSFLRNKERPLYFAEVKGHDILLFASEGGMLSLVCEKHDIELREEPWLLKTNIIMSFNVHEKKDVLGTRDVEEDIVYYKAPVYQSYNRSANRKKSSGVTTSPLSLEHQRGTTGGSVVPFTRQKKTLTDFQLKQDDKVFFVPKTFKPFGAQKGVLDPKGSITGVVYGGLLDPREIGEGVVYSRRRSLFADIKGSLVEGNVSGVSYPSGIDKGGSVCLSAGDKLTDKQADEYWKTKSDLDALEVMKEEVDDSTIFPFRGPNNNPINASRFTHLTLGGCCMCLDPIPVTIASSKEISWVYDDQPMCKSCTDYYTERAEAEGESMDTYLMGGIL